jgi:hypothetical protein
VIAGVDLTTEPDDVANILVDLAQRETKTFSLQFARMAVGELKTTARLHKHPMKSAGFVVLRAPDVPSVLVELGYMSTKDDLKQLTSEAWRVRTAAAMAQAVATFFGPQWMSMLFGFVFLSHQLGSFSGLWLAGVLYDQTNSYDMMWWISIGLGLFAALVHLPIRERPVARLETAATA